MKKAFSTEFNGTTVGVDGGTPAFINDAYGTPVNLAHVIHFGASLPYSTATYYVVVAVMDTLGKPSDPGQPIEYIMPATGDAPSPWPTFYFTSPEAARAAIPAFMATLTNTQSSRFVGSVLLPAGYQAESVIAEQANALGSFIDPGVITETYHSSQADPAGTLFNVEWSFSALPPGTEVDASITLQLAAVA